MSKIKGKQKDEKPIVDGKPPVKESVEDMRKETKPEKIELPERDMSKVEEANALIKKSVASAKKYLKERALFKKMPEDKKTDE